MASMLFLTLTLDRCAYAFGAVVAARALARDVNLNDRKAADALLSRVIGAFASADTLARMRAIITEADAFVSDDARDDDAFDDLRAFAAYVTHHPDAPKQCARYKRRVLKYAREYVSVGACLDRNERRALREGHLALAGDSDVLDASAPNAPSEYDGAPNAEHAHAQADA